MHCLLNAVQGTECTRSACARLGKHYVDLCGEQHWIRDMVLQCVSTLSTLTSTLFSSIHHRFDYVAHKTGAMIIPACGFDSAPSDLAVYLSNKTLKALVGPSTDISTSLTAFDVSGALSGGTLATFITALEQVPRYKIQVAHKDWAMSTHMRGARRMPKKLVYSLPFSNPPVVGGLWFMGAANKAIVQRTWGLTERAVRPTPACCVFLEFCVFTRGGRSLGEGERLTRGQAAHLRRAVPVRRVHGDALQVRLRLAQPRRRLWTRSDAPPAGDYSLVSFSLYLPSLSLFVGAVASQEVDVRTRQRAL